MSMVQKISQPHGVGIRRELRGIEKDQIICLLRAVERLPIISQLGVEPNVSQDVLRRCLEAIHLNHLELAKYAAAVMSEEDCGEKPV